MSRYVVTKLEGYTTPTTSGGRPKGVSYMVQDEAAIRNAAHEREAASPAKGTGA